ncbi:hypothetical protein OS493_032865 [Desmophyllum pertusum]|uniref:Uncharacterized protein n=1 Tax=Desmophyllum pertusum TaxID=174260 RepID=A0A9W9YJ13_9CNID|nr:hypothetical protein OS493_032865 [Desmophyllum pertusum]
MHKRNVNRNTDSLRIARATQVRLDEISDKIEREKHRSIKSNHHEKIKIWNELKSIHRVFDHEPLYGAIRENRERLERNPIAASKVDTVQNVGNRTSNNTAVKELEAGEFVKQPRLLRRAETQNETLAPRRRHTEPKIQPFVGRQVVLSHSKSRAHVQNPALLRPRSQSWSQSRRSEPQTIAKLNRRHRRASENTSPNFVLPPRSLTSLNQCRRFRSMSMDEEELSANSRLVMPEQADSIDEKKDVLMFSTQTNPHIVKKNNKQKPAFNRRLSTCVGSRRQLSSSLSWPLGELPMRSPDTIRRKSSLTPDLLRAKNTEAPQSRSQMSAKDRPAMKAERSKRSKASGCNMRARSSESDEEDKFGTFDENPISVKIRHTRLNKAKAFSRSSKLLRPLGTGCFSESFQAVSQWEK